MYALKQADFKNASREIIRQLLDYNDFYYTVSCIRKKSKIKKNQNNLMSNN